MMNRPPANKQKTMEKVRLRRKFNHRPQFDYVEQLVMILRTQIIFQLIVMLLICSLRLSLEIKTQNIFVCEFWTSDDVKNNNLAIGLGLVLFCPYLIFIQKTKVNMIKDCYLTVLIFHLIAAYVNSQTKQGDFVLFIGILGFAISSVTQYLSMVLEQKKLIQEINKIESQDRKIIKFEESQFAALTTFDLYDSK